MNRTFKVFLALGIFLICAGGTLYAQRPGGQPQGGSISGTVVDSATGDALISATVTIMNAKDSSLATGALTEPDGSFAIAGIRPGRYYARISFIGYATQVIDAIDLKPGAMQAPLGTIAIAEKAIEGDAVSVTAKRDFMTVGIDRTIYKTADLPVTAGGTASDVLKNVPTVEVDMDGNVSLRGNQNVVIHLNGRPMVLSGQSLATFLQGFPADVIERIEIIPNPSAKYDPEGMTGIINIVLKQESNIGLAGGVNGSASTNNQYNAGANVTWGNGPWNLFASYGLNLGRRESGGTRYREALVPTLVPILEQTSADSNSRLSHVFNSTIDFAFDRMNSVSLSAMLSTRSRESEGLNSNVERDMARAITRRYDRSTSDTDGSLGSDLRLGYKWVKETSRHELSAEVRYSADAEDDNGFFRARDLTVEGEPQNNTPSLQRTRTSEDTREITAQIDYVQPIGERARLEAGYKSEFERISEDVYSESFDYTANAYLPDLQYNNVFTYDRNIHAVYVNYGQEFGIVGAQVGLRAEQAATEFDLATTGQVFDNDYFSVFPSAFLTVKPDETIQFKGSYSRRINRPGIWSLNPFSGFEDPQFRRTGNPYLKPEYINSFEIGATHFTDLTTLTVTPYFRRTTDVIRHYARTDSNGVTTVTNENFDVNDSYGADFVGTFRLVDRLNLIASASAYRVVTNGQNVEADLTNDAFGWNMRMNATVTIMEGLDLQMTYSYRAPIKIEGGEFGGQTNSDVALQQKFLDNRARIGLRVSDVFNTSGFSVKRADDLFFQDFNRSWNARAVTLTFSYSFGSQDRSSRRTRGGQDQQPSRPPDDVEY